MDYCYTSALTYLACTPSEALSDNDLANLNAIKYEYLEQGRISIKLQLFLLKFVNRHRSALH
jgi:hypothetical protein